MANDTNERTPAARDEFISNLDAALEACEVLGDDAQTRQTGRKILAVLAYAADAVLRDGGQALHSAPDKVGAFFERLAAAYVATVEGMHKRAAAETAPLAGGDFLPYRPRAADPLANAWGAVSPGRGEAERE
jgi:hypothetical protein